MCRSTTTVIQAELGEGSIIQTEVSGSEPHAVLIIPDELKQCLGEIPADIFCHEELIPDVSKVSIVVLAKIFSRLNVIRQKNEMTEKQLATLEKYRLCMMKAVTERLKEHEHTRPPADVISVEDRSIFTRIHEWLKTHCPALLKVLFGFFFTLGLCFEAIFYYVGFAEMLGGLFTAFTSLTNPVTLAVCGALTVLNLILYCAFDGSMLGEMFDVQIAANEKQKLEAYVEQTIVLTEMNRLLNDVSVLRDTSVGQYICYSNFGVKCNALMSNRQIDFADCKESPRKTMLRWGITVVGALLTLGSGYFSGVAILPALALTLANPWGVAFVAILMASMFIVYFAMQGRSIAHLLSPNLDKKKEVREHLNKFSPKEAEDFRALMIDKRQGMLSRVSDLPVSAPQPAQDLDYLGDGVKSDASFEPQKKAGF